MTYWAKTSDETIREFSTSKNGLDDREIGERLTKYGLNDIPVRKKKSAISLLISQMKDVLIIALTVASVISLFTGGVEEAVATGKKSIETAVQMYRIVNGKVVENLQVSNPLGLLIQLGAVEYTEKGKKLFPEDVK